MNIKTILITPIITLACGIAVAQEVAAPPDLKGSKIKFSEAVISLNEETLIQYTPKGNKAELVVRTEDMDGRTTYITVLSGANTVDKIHAEKVPPAVITFTKKEGHVYHGTLNGSWYTAENYQGEVPTELKSIKNAPVKITMPKEGEPTDGKIDAPFELPDNTLIEIKTDKKTHKYRLEQDDCSMIEYVADGKTASMDLSLPFTPPKSKNAPIKLQLLSGGEDFAYVASYKDTSKPRILFMEKKGKTYKGILQGYLYTYYKKSNDTDDEPALELISTETLQSITITLP